MRAKVKKNNIIFSRVKENVNGFLSIFDAPVEEEDPKLPEELSTSSKTLEKRAKMLETYGTLFPKTSGAGTTKKPTRVNRIKPATMKEKDKNNIKNIENEREI